MDLRRYVAEQERANRIFAARMAVLLAPMVGSASKSAVSRVVAAAYPAVFAARSDSAQRARAFYDATRTAAVGSTYPVNLASYRPQWYASDMAPVVDLAAARARKDAAADIRRPVSDQLAPVIGLATKQVENGGRQTTKMAVDADPEAVAWARVPGGAESCAFCTMLISRGPVYKSRESAGGDEAYHAHCDCKIVPVYDVNDWPGRDDYLAIKNLWFDKTKGVSSAGKLAAFRQYLDGQNSGYADARKAA